MGCTSSAPNMADSQTSTTGSVLSEIENLENNKSGDSEEIARENKLNSNGYKTLDRKQVLAECEVNELSQDQLDRNNSSLKSEKNNSKLHTVGHRHFWKSMALEKQKIPKLISNKDVYKTVTFKAPRFSDVQVSASMEEHEKTVDNTEDLQKEELNICLRDVVDKVISGNTDEGEQNLNNVEEIEKDVDKQIEEIMEVNDTFKVEEIECNKDNNSEESTSPTQSEDSRATRWEALADIAAELPPSLAVDPLTGQIYTLAK